LQLFLEGESLFNQGRRDEGGDYFLRALGQLVEPKEEPVPNRQLEGAYFSLLGKIEDLRLEDLDSAREEDSPIEWLANRNVFTIRVDPKLKHLASEDLLTSEFDVPVVLNERVLRFLTYYRTRGRVFMERGLRRSGRYLTMFREVFRREGVPLDLVYVAHIESLFRPHALSRARAKGIWQFIPGTGRLYGLRQNWWIDERSDILKSTVAAARFLKYLYGEFGDWYLALAGYNCGPRRIERILRRYGRIDYWEMARRRLLPRETRNYVPSYLAATIIFKNPIRYGFQVAPDPELRFELIPLTEQVDLETVAELIEVPARLLDDLNPELRRRVTPFKLPGYQMKVPLGTGELAQKKVAQLPPEKRIKLRHHRVRKGETLSLIARRYATSIQAIAQANRLRSIHRLRIGQELAIPLFPSGRGGAARRAASRVRRSDSSGPHVVSRGDTLYAIARAYGVKLKDLLRWNNLSPRQRIFPGQKILVSP
jgi:membrane-bound lytic murein transglycosylase D